MWEYKVVEPPIIPANEEERERLRVWLEEQSQDTFELAELHFDQMEPIAIFKRRRSPARKLFRGKK